MLNPIEINPSVRGAVDEVIQRAALLGIEVMGYAHDFPSWMTNIDGDLGAIPYRNTTEYNAFLDEYEKSWETLAREFPQINVWEIGNEYNLDEFLHPEGYNKSDPYSPRFTDEEKADIVTDLLFYGSQGIKSGNPKAKTVMCGLGPGGNGINDIKNFLDSIYKNIESGRWPSTNSNKFFEVACWHPYLGVEKPTEQNWVLLNNAVHNVMVAHGDVNKRVVFSEFGYSDKYVPRDKVAEYLAEAFRLAKNNFPWLDTIYWYRLIDRNLTYEEGPAEMDGFGLIESPETWKWKQVAYTYKSLAYPENSHISVLFYSKKRAMSLASSSSLISPKFHQKVKIVICLNLW
jgi:hypothetical protein